RDAIKEAGKLRKANPAQLATGERYAAGAVSLRSGDKEAQVSQAFLAGVRALILWNGDASSSDKSGGDLVSARQNLEKVVSLDPSVTLAQFCLGRVLLLSGDAAAAEPCFLKALQLNPVWVDAHMNLGATYYAEKKYKDSVAEYEKVTGLEPRNAEAFARLGLARSDMGKTKDGVKDLERAIELDNNSGLAHFNLGIVFAESKKKKDRQRAEQEFTLAIEKNQDNRQFKNSDAERRLAELKGNKKK
ncbi:MAG TPA: tetratricopeptide repeat protein, partial [Blastocatellia bacterium]|nr:tetratricopeptide repeat protein [Blastocatellia bacterium]